MDKSIIDSICQRIYRQHPEFKGRRPRVSDQANGNSVLIFECSVKGGNGQSIPRSLRVTVGQTGRIIKISTSKG